MRVSVKGDLYIGQHGEFLKIATDVAYDFEVTAAKVLDVLLHEPDRCEEKCRMCGEFQCIGNSPHTKEFGPFHVFQEHDHLELQELP